MQRAKLAARILVAAVLGAGPILAATPARAYISGPCDGSVTIQDSTYTPANDTVGNPIVVPEKGGGAAAWQGSTQFPIHNHNGAVSVSVGPFDATLATWGSENDKDETAASGTYPLNEFRDKVSIVAGMGGITGIWEVTAFHNGTEGQCSGAVMVRVQGNPLGSPFGIGAGVVTLVSATGMAWAAVPKGKVL